MVADRNIVIAEIQRLALQYGKAPGKELFERETGMQSAEWYPKLWLRWSDAIKEAGLQPNKFNERTSDGIVLNKYCGFIRELGHVPVIGEIRNRAADDSSFPAHTVFHRYGGKEKLVEAALSYCTSHAGFEDVLIILQTYRAGIINSSDESIPRRNISKGCVYLMKSGKYYKIGRTISLERREREVGLIVPEMSKAVHWIETDDPSGIEAYWHRRYADKRHKGEWFRLSNEDVAAFKRWKKIV